MLVLLSSFSLWLRESEYEEGNIILKLATDTNVESPAKIEITEYFSYGCPHCFRFEGLISQWRNQLESDIVFNRSPCHGMFQVP